VMISRWNVFTIMRRNTAIGSFEVETLVAGGLDREAAFLLAMNFGKGVRVREEAGSVLLDEHGFRAKSAP
jgi:hypothetical protein